MRPDRPGQALGSSRSGIPLRIVYALLRTLYALLRMLYAILRMAVNQIARSRLLARIAARQGGQMDDQSSTGPAASLEHVRGLARRPHRGPGPAIRLAPIVARAARRAATTG